MKKGVVEPERKSPTEPILSTFNKLLRLSVYERLKKGETMPIANKIIAILIKLMYIFCIYFVYNYP